MNNTDISPARSGAFPYGADQGAATSPLLTRHINPVHLDDVCVGVVTDVSTQHHCCTVTVPNRTAGYGIPCIWASSGINRWGGVVETHPPEVGSVVAVYLLKNAPHGIVLGQIPSLLIDPVEARGHFFDALREVTAFQEDSGQDWKTTKTSGSALNGYQRHFQDVFPGEQIWHNELGVALAVLRARALLQGSELAKVEAFWMDDLLRLTGHNMDIWTCGTEFSIREDKGGVIGTEYNETMTGREARFPEAKRLLARRRILGGAFGDISRDFVLIPSFDPDNPDMGLSEVYRDSAGLIINRSVAGGGFVKTRSIGVPRRKRDAQDPLGSVDENPTPDLEKLKDFEWENRMPVERAQQVRDALAWIMNVQASAKLAPFGDKIEDWEVFDDSPSQSAALARGNKGGDVGAGGHLRDDDTEMDPNLTDPARGGKPRCIRVNDAWIIILPDGTVAVRDGWASCFTMSRGHITMSPSKDLNVIAGRNFNVKAGGDITLEAFRSLDAIASHGQMHLYADRTIFTHSENGGLMFSTNSEAGSSKPNKIGEEFEVGGIVFKTPGDFTVFATSQFSNVSKIWSVSGQMPLSGRGQMIRPDIFFEGRSMSTKSEGTISWRIGRRYAAMFDSEVTLRVGGTVETEGNFDAPVGTVRVNKTHDDHKNEDFCISPDKDWFLLSDLLSPFYDNTNPNGSASVTQRNKARKKCKQSPASNSRVRASKYDWSKLHGGFNLTDLPKVGFSFRTEKDYRTDVEDFGWTEQAWMREWSGSTVWSEAAYTRKRDGRDETYPYPGKKHWTQSKTFYKYEEVNVTRTGNVKPRNDLTSKGEFRGHTFKQLGRHP